MKRVCQATAGLAALLLSHTATAEAPPTAPPAEAPPTATAPAAGEPPAGEPTPAATPPAAGEPTPAATAPAAGEPTAPAPVEPVSPAPAPAPVAPAPAPAAAPVAPAPVAAAPVKGRPLGKKYTSWDANLEGGIGRVFSPGETTGLGRVRAGVLVIRDPHFYSFGVTYELSHLSAATVGAQAEYLNLESGMWAQIGPLVDVEHGGRMGFMGSVGLSLLGIEYQGRDYQGGFASAIFGKIRIPLGMIGFGLRGR